MSSAQEISAALEEALRALRDVAGLDPTRPSQNPSDKVARRSLERISQLIERDVASPGRTPRPGERTDHPPLLSDSPNYY